MSGPTHQPTLGKTLLPLSIHHSLAPDYLAEALTLAWPVKTRTKTRT